jgi:starvation-inducible DNA-binding protein
MPKRDGASRQTINAQPRIHQHAKEIQAYGTVAHALPLELEEDVRLEMTEQLNQMLADTITLRDLYKKSHWQVAGPTFYQLHLLFDKHFDEQTELVDTIAERIQLLGGYRWRWRMTSRRLRASNVHRVEGKKCPYRSHAYWMHTNSSSDTAAHSGNGHRS